MIRSKNREDERYLEGVDCRSTNALTCNKINTLELNERRTSFKRMSSKNVGACSTISCVSRLWNHFLKYLKLTDPLACIANLAVLQALNRIGWLLSNLAENDSESSSLDNRVNDPTLISSGHKAFIKSSPGFYQI